MNAWTRLVRTVAPASPVVSLDEAKRHLRVLHEDDDADIELMVTAAIASIEGPNGIGIALSPQTWRMSLDHFPSEIIVPLGPVTSVTSVAYTDAYGAPRVVEGIRYDLDESPLRILPPRDKVWPAVTCEPGVVKITFVCGFPTLPADLRAAILLLVGHLYENREAVTANAVGELPMSVSSIIERYRVGRFA